MGDQNWRLETNAEDYFTHQHKKSSVEGRRPVIRRASDLVGPGIGSEAVRITDFGDLLVTYDGYYSAVAGAIDAPNPTDSFVGITVMDSTLGGWQEFQSLETGAIYRRLFLRNPTDPTAINWGVWVPNVLASDITALAGRDTALEGRATALEGRATSLEGRATTLEGKALYTGVMLFFMTSEPTGNIVSGTASYGVTLPSAPVAWAVKAGFVSGSSLTQISAVDLVTTTDCRISIVNVGASPATFTNLPIRWFARLPG